MFRTWPLSKSFAVLSGPLLVGAALLMGMMNHIWYVEGIERVAERNNVALARILSNVVWPQFRAEILASQESDESSNSEGWRKQLTAEIASVVRDTAVAKIKLYRTDGSTAYSTDHTETDEEEEDNGGFQAAMKGQVASELEFEDKINSFDKVVSDRNTVSSYVPIFDASDPTKVVAVFEIYDDITALLAQFHDAEFRTSLFVAGLFLSIYACLVIFVGRSERAAKSHYEHGLRLADVAARADAASTAKSEFLANMSHELRTPLNAIVGFSEVMKEGLLGPVTPRPYAEYVRHIWMSASHLTDIIGNILDLSKIDAGKVTVEKARVALPETILLVCGMMQDRASKRGITFTQEVDPSLDILVTDPVKLRQILLNLLSNAIKFTHQGGHVMMQAICAGENVVFEIRDTGIGMNEDEIKIAMSPFGQIESPFSRMHEGTGLGLPLTQRLVTLIGGRMEIRSEKGVGTRVKVILPADAAVSAPESRPMPAIAVAKMRAPAE
ncbi:MAG TPA: HAMP domain-containing sensor histidine kinase [Dongiaceae bacterium]|jgi:two-component system cell cycle sensor histidine kinase PleC